MTSMMLLAFVVAAAGIVVALVALIGRRSGATEIARELSELRVGAERQASTLRQEVVANVARLANGIGEQQAQGRTELAGHLERMRETIARNLARMEADGALKRNRGDIVVLDRARLERMARESD